MTLFTCRYYEYYRRVFENLKGKGTKEEACGRNRRGKRTRCVEAIRDIMQDRAAGNGVTSAVGFVYEGGICLTLICTIKELLIFT